MLLKTWQRWKKKFSGRSFTRFQATWMDYIYLKGDADMGIETNNFLLCTGITVRTWWESPSRWEKKIPTRSLAEAKLEQFCYGFFCHPQVFFFSSNLVFLINPYFHTFNWHIQVLFMQKKFRTSVLIRSFSSDSGLSFLVIQKVSPRPLSDSTTKKKLFFLCVLPKGARKKNLQS